MSDYDGWKRGPQITCEERDAILRLPPEQGSAYRQDVHVYAARTRMRPGGRSTCDWGVCGRDEPLVAEELIQPDQDGHGGSCRHWRFVPDPAIDAAPDVTV